MVRTWGRVEEERVVEMVKRCFTPGQLKEVYGHVVASGQSQNNFVGAKLVRSFAALGCLEHARAVARLIHRPNAFVWTALIRGHSEADKDSLSIDALHLYKKMHQYPEAKPLTFTLSSVLKSCSKLVALEEGKQIHAHAFKHGFQLDPRVQTTLIDLYGKCNQMGEARKVFDRILGAGLKDVQVWNTMIAVYVEAGAMELAHELFVKIPERNTFTWVKMIDGYAMLSQMDSARRLLELANSPDVVMDTAMITGYARSGDIAAARSVFDEMNKRDVACWNAMLSAYMHAGLNDEALDLFRSMVKNSSDRKKVEPNHVTIATIASACADSGSSGLVNWIRDYIDRRGSNLLNSHTVAALIDLHCKCGDLDQAYDLFSRWKFKDLICYSSMISGFGIHGHGKDAIAVFESLREAGLQPDPICFLSVLTACSHSGMLNEGRNYFKMMKEYHINATADHYMCKVDLLGRAGYILEAYRLITEDMPTGVQPHAGVWGALLSACRIYSNIEVGEVAARHLMDLEPENAGNYVLLSNIYAKARRWEGVARVRALMRGRGMKKPPGWSSVEIEGCSRRFLAAESYDVGVECMLELVDWELKKYGYFARIQEHE